ncbi:MAG: hypothetical protein ABI601_06025 [bacterium]
MPASGPADRKSLDAILERAAADPAFRQELLGDWRGAIQRSFNIIIPTSFTMRFIERAPGVDALIVLPDLQAADGELSAHELENVAGGGGEFVADSTRW